MGGGVVVVEIALELGQSRCRRPGRHWARLECARATWYGFWGLGSVAVGVGGTAEKPATIWALPLPVKSRKAPMCSVPPKLPGSWNPPNPGTAVTAGLTVPEFPLLSASPAMTAPGWFRLGGWSSPMLKVSSAGV